MTTQATGKRARMTRKARKLEPQHRYINCRGCEYSSNPERFDGLCMLGGPCVRELEAQQAQAAQMARDVHETEV